MIKKCLRIGDCFGNGDRDDTMKVSLVASQRRTVCDSGYTSNQRSVRLCEELNACMAAESYLAAIMLLRAIIDHVPPIFNCQNFDQVISQTKGRSFQPQLERLNSQARDVADRYLHGHIGTAEGLPKRPQVEFRSELDALLGEVVARLQ